MPLTEIGILAVVVFLFLLFIRVPIGFAAMIVTVIGTSIIISPGPALAQLGGHTVRITLNYGLSVVPLFVLMGTILTKVNLGADLFEVLNSVLGRRKGGMALATIAAGGAFSAVSGSVVASVATLTPACVPEMRKYNYDAGFATGVTAVSAAFGVVIPPSTALVIYGFLTEESIGQVLMGGILPGIMIMVLLMLTVPVILKFKPEYAPVRAEKVPFPWKTFRYVWAVPAIFILSFGGIYAGLFTPTEAGAVGAFLSIIFGLITRRLTFKIMIESLSTAAKVTAMVFFMIIGGTMFGMLLTRSLLPMQIASFIVGLDVAPTTIMLLILALYTFLGLFMEEMATLIILTPIFYPIVIGMGYSGIWFGVMTIMMKISGFITPPVGLITLLGSAMAGVPSSQVFKAQWPFYVTVILSCIILIFFPQIATFLPDLMFG